MKRATIVSLRPVEQFDGDFLIGFAKWVATDSQGRRFGGDTPEEAQALAEQYSQPTPRKARNPREGSQ
jgi:hypothetical protein